MKSIGLGLLCLLGCTVVAWAWHEPEYVDEAEPQPIFAYFTYQNKRYGLSLNKLNWFEAQLFCASQKYTLANIAEETDQSTIMSFIQTYAASDLPLLANETIWTSGTNQAGDSQYMWHSSGARMNFRNFENTNLPNGFRCIALNGVSGYWTAENCRDQHYFVCELKCSTDE